MANRPDREAVIVALAASRAALTGYTTALSMSLKKRLFVTSTLPETAAALSGPAIRRSLVIRAVMLSFWITIVSPRRPVRARDRSV